MQLLRRSLLPAGVALLSLLAACKSQHADVILINGHIHTVNAQDDIVQAVAIDDGKIVGMGTSDDIQFNFSADTVVDLRGRPAYPGFIDAHCHFAGYAQNLEQVDLFYTTAWDEVITLVDTFAARSKSEWIQGRGWDQNKWEEKTYPVNDLLNQRFPDRPVFLMRVDGHAAIANDEALRRAGIDENTSVAGGYILKRDGKLTGVLIDNAVDLVKKVIPPPSPAELEALLIRAEADMFSVGLTTVDDAGLDLRTITLIDSLQKAGKLRIRVYAMATDNQENLDYWLKKGPYKTDRLNVRAFKVYADGSLGSRGACLLAPYTDEPAGQGFLLHSRKYFRDMAHRLYEAGFQMNTHCIGDSANRFILRVYGEALQGKNDRRWRIEHCQVVDTTDFWRFGAYNIIPSVQPTHATSDMGWAENRIGKERLKGAYAYLSLFEQNKMIAFGTDFPVEHINPLLSFYTAIQRQDLQNFPPEGFLPEQAVGRDTALRAMTIWAAHSNFEEKEKGSIEVGKLADIVVLEKDIMFMDPKQIPYTRAILTLLNGEIVFSAPNP